MNIDKVLVTALSSILKELKDERSDINRSDVLNDEIAKDYDRRIEVLEKVLPYVKKVDDLFCLDSEDDFICVIECLEMYESAFIIDGTDDKRLKESEKKYEELVSLIDLFYEDDEESEEEEE